MLRMAHFYFSEMGCGQPHHVVGSSYGPTFPCLDFNCSFTFTCRDRYTLVGTSASRQDNLVRCGAVSDGLWDFGTLHCLGGFCLDFRF